MHPHFDRGANRLVNTQLVPQTQSAVYDGISHATARLCFNSRRHTSGMDLEGHAPFPQRSRADLLGDSDARTRTQRARHHADASLATRRGPRSIQPNICPHPALLRLPRPLLLNVGRVAVEKNIEAFLDCPIAGSKVVVGDGPALESLKKRYPQVAFLGAKHGSELASCYAAADVFVFPSRTDTFGLVNIEALACGVPVAAFPVPGPLDILGFDGRGVHGGSRRIGAVDDSLGNAVRRALTADRTAAAAEARRYSWEHCTDLFQDGLASEAAKPMLTRVAA